MWVNVSKSWVAKRRIILVILRWNSSWKIYIFKETIVWSCQVLRITAVACVTKLYCSLAVDTCFNFQPSRILKQHLHIWQLDLCPFRFDRLKLLRAQKEQNMDLSQTSTENTAEQIEKDIKCRWSLLFWFVGCRNVFCGLQWRLSDNTRFWNHMSLFMWLNVTRNL